MKTWPQRSSSKRVLTEDQNRSLLALLDLIIPPDPGKGLPGAGELNFVGYVAKFEPGRIDALRLELDALNREAKERHGRAFADLEPDERTGLVGRLRGENAQFAQNIVALTMACYYQDDNVLVALGMEARPPYPKGNKVESGDLSLLEPVRKRKQMYRNP